MLIRIMRKGFPIWPLMMIRWKCNYQSNTESLHHPLKCFKSNSVLRNNLLLKPVSKQCLHGTHNPERLQQVKCQMSKKGERASWKFVRSALFLHCWFHCLSLKSLMFWTKTFLFLILSEAHLMVHVIRIVG